MRLNFDKKAKARVFKEGDQVLAFIPALKSPLKVKYRGPYIVKEKVRDNNDIINTPDRRNTTQLIHANLLKLYRSKHPLPDSQSRRNIHSFDSAKSPESASNNSCPSLPICLLIELFACL